MICQKSPTTLRRSSGLRCYSLHPLVPPKLFLGSCQVPSPCEKIRTEVAHQVSNCAMRWADFTPFGPRGLDCPQQRKSTKLPEGFEPMPRTGAQEFLGSPRFGVPKERHPEMNHRRALTKPHFTDHGPNYTKRKVSHRAKKPVATGIYLHTSLGNQGNISSSTPLKLSYPQVIDPRINEPGALIRGTPYSNQPRGQMQVHS